MAGSQFQGLISEPVRGLTLVAALAACLVRPAAAVPEATPAPTAPPAERRLVITNKPWTGDFDQMLARRVIRVLVPYSRTLYFNDKGRERGVTADTVRDFEGYLNRKYARQLGKRPLTVIMVTTTRDQLLPGLAAGLGDIAAGNLTVTEARQKVADFASPADLATVRELVITGPASPRLTSVEDLSGRKIHVRPSSSYYESVVALNGRLRKSGKAPATIVSLPDALEDEDVLEMLNAGLLELAVVDDWKAKIWVPVLPKITIREDLVLHDGGHVGWAIRKNSPRLLAEIEDFYAGFAKRQDLIAYRLKQYQKRIKQISNNTNGAELKRFQNTLALFDKYGAQYAFDPLMLAAQGYQESHLDQKAKSRVGAVGIMQVMPATGASLKVGNIRQIEPNIHAGAKYLDQLMTQYFSDAKFTESERPLFAFASYNAGPANIAKMRKEAAQRGLDPDRWFNHVELVVAEKIGQETTTYVRNIFKYYVAYKLTLEAQEAARKAREQATSNTAGISAVR